VALSRQGILTHGSCCTIAPPDAPGIRPGGSRPDSGQTTDRTLPKPSEQAIDNDVTRI